MAAASASVVETLGYGVGGGLGFSAGFVFFRWIASFIAGRIDKQQDRIDTGMQALIAGLEKRLAEEKESRLSEIARREKVEAEFHEELEAFREKLQECERKHAAAEVELQGLRATINAQGSMRNEAQALIATERVLDRKRARERGDEI